MSQRKLNVDLCWVFNGITLEKCAQDEQARLLNKLPFFSTRTSHTELRAVLITLSPSKSLMKGRSELHLLICIPEKLLGSPFQWTLIGFSMIDFFTFSSTPFNCNSLLKLLLLPDEIMGKNIIFFPPPSSQPLISNCL